MLQMLGPGSGNLKIYRGKILQQPFQIKQFFIAGPVIRGNNLTKY